ncbi:hypothetical protein HYU40_01290 [Candidatus Woesearchaeota archaeon]|nr:hypothetical protein [Candidatus Woesearchaeota archaeon]
MDVSLLIEGGTQWKERLEDALRRADVTAGTYNRDKPGITRALIQKRILLPLHVDFTQTYGQRWLGLFTFLESTEEHQTVMIVRNQFFPPMDDLSLPKRWYLLPARRWHPEKGKDNLSVREALEAKLRGFTLEQVIGIDDVPVGLDFAGVSANTHYKVTNPYNWLRGRKMLAAFEEQLTIRYEPFGKNMTIRLQFGREDLSQALEGGIRIVAENVPSFSGEQAPHKITITGAPVYYVETDVDEKAKRRGYDIFTSDDCMRNVFSDDKFSRKIKSVFGKQDRVGSENEFDHHSVLVLDAAAKLVSQQYPFIALDDPIPAVPEGVEELVEVAFRRIRVTGPGVADEGIMLWQSKALMQIYTIMATAYMNGKRLQEQGQIRISGKRQLNTKR